MDDPAPHNAGPTPDAASAAPVDAACPGATLGDYRLGACLAPTAAADVYDATHLPSGTPRVVYVLRPHAVQDHPLMHRVVCEVDAARWLRHPAAAKVDGYGDVPGGRMYVAVERAPGRSLTARLAGEGRFTPRRVVRLACRLVEALEEAHAVGLVHGRLTPDAVVIGDDADAAGAPLVTLTGLGVGAVAFDAAVADAERAYVGPEQWAGGAADVRGDVFGLASVLWAALTGEAPPAVDAGCGTPAAVPAADVLQAARSAEPGRRHASVRAFWEELVSALVADAGAAGAGLETTPGGPAFGPAAAGSPAPALAAFDLAAFDLADLELTPAPAAVAAPASPHATRPAVPDAELAFGGLAVWAAPPAAGPHAAVPNATPGAVPNALPDAVLDATMVPALAAGYAPPFAWLPGPGHPPAHELAAPPRPRRAAPPPARAYRWEEQHRAPVATPWGPARAAKRALPWWLAVPAVAAAAVGGPLARDWASPGAAPEAHSAGEVVEPYQPPRVARHQHRERLVALPADTAAADDTLPTVPWVDVPEIELPAPADGTRAVVRPEDFAGGLGGARGPR